jgi:hypothetical protein
VREHCLLQLLFFLCHADVGCSKILLTILVIVASLYSSSCQDRNGTAALLLLVLLKQEVASDCYHCSVSINVAATAAAVGAAAATVTATAAAASVAGLWVGCSIAALPYALLLKTVSQS